MNNSVKKYDPVRYLALYKTLVLLWGQSQPDNPISPTS